MQCKTDTIEILSLAHQLELKADANEEEGFAEAALAFAAASAAVFRLVDEITAEL